MKYRILVIEQDEIIVEADNDDEARKIAEDQFRDEFDRDSHDFQFLINDKHE